MASVSGSYTETNVPTVAALIVLLQAHYAVQEARITALGGVSTHITGNATVKIYCSNGAAAYHTHRINHSINVAAIAGLTSTTTSLSTFMTALVNNSAFTTILEVSVTAQTVFSN